MLKWDSDQSELIYVLLSCGLELLFEAITMINCIDIMHHYEFQAILYGERRPCEIGKRPENLQKNRFKTTFPCAFCYISLYIKNKSVIYFIHDISISKYHDFVRRWSFPSGSLWHKTRLYKRQFHWCKYCQIVIMLSLYPTFSVSQTYSFISPVVWGYQLYFGRHLSKIFEHLYPKQRVTKGILFWLIRQFVHLSIVSSASSVNTTPLLPLSWSVLRICCIFAIFARISNSIIILKWCPVCWNFKVCPN